MVRLSIGRRQCLCKLNLYSGFPWEGEHFNYFTAAGQLIFLTKQAAEIVIKMCAFLEPLMN